MYPGFPASCPSADIDRSMKSRALCLPLLLALLACAGPPPQIHSTVWDDFVKHFLDSSYAADPAFAVTLGRHEFDGRLPDFSDAGIRRQIARLRAAREKALAFDFAKL